MSAYNEVADAATTLLLSAAAIPVSNGQPPLAADLNALLLSRVQGEAGEDRGMRAHNPLRCHSPLRALSRHANRISL
jgi:hypothetical protein